MQGHLWLIASEEKWKHRLINGVTKKAENEYIYHLPRPAVGRCVSSTNLGLLRPGSLRVLCSISVVPWTALYWAETLDVVRGICWSHSPSLGLTAPNASITGTTLDFNLRICSSCSLRPWFFLIFSCSFSLKLLSVGIGTSISTVLFCYLSATTKSGWLASS